MTNLTCMVDRMSEHLALSSLCFAGCRFHWSPGLLEAYVPRRLYGPPDRHAATGPYPTETIELHLLIRCSFILSKTVVLLLHDTLWRGFAGKTEQHSIGEKQTCPGWSKLIKRTSTPKGYTRCVTRCVHFEHFGNLAWSRGVICRRDGRSMALRRRLSTGFAYFRLLFTLALSAVWKKYLMFSGFLRFSSASCRPDGWTSDVWAYKAWNPPALARNWVFLYAWDLFRDQVEAGLQDREPRFAALGPIKELVSDRLYVPI